ncbi:hypothetical protein NC652_040590 [Populus alba x Populus x berolinensis]|nr:hypothetical protein NC652_040590 [Populus alba x Populus x berolinensis]
MKMARYQDDKKLNTSHSYYFFFQEALELKRGFFLPWEISEATVRKWKEIVDDWVRLNPQGEHASSGLMENNIEGVNEIQMEVNKYVSAADGDSPQQKIPQNGHHQILFFLLGSDFAYSPNPHNGSSGSDRNNSEPERKPKPAPPQTKLRPNLLKNQSLHLHLLLTMYRDKENNRKQAILMLIKGLPRQGKGFKRIIKKLKMV